MATTTTTAITQEQINACTRVVDVETGSVFYRVRSERDPLVEYIVRYVKDAHRPGKGYFTCTCPAGEDGFAHCSQGTCKHVRWALVAEEARRAEKQARARFIVNGKPVDDETWKRVQNAKPYPWTEEEIKRDQQRYASRPWTLLK